MIGTTASRQHLGVLLLILAAPLIAHANSSSGLTLRLGPTTGAVLLETVADGAAWEVPVGAGPVRLDVVPSLAGARSFVVDLDGTPIVTFPAVATSPLELAVAEGSDDAETFWSASAFDPDRWPAGFSYHSDVSLELGNDPDHGSQVVGVRFADLGVPAGARIIAAAVVFTAGGISDGDLMLTIWGERSPEPDAFAQNREGEGTSDLTRRLRSEASVSWSIDEPWRNRTSYGSPDLSAIVQEVVDLEGWGADSGLVLLFGAAEPGSSFRRALSFEGARGDRDAVPRLRLGFEATRDVPPVTATFDAPPGTSELTITAYGAPDGQGDPVAVASVTMVRPAATVIAPAPEPEPAAPVPAGPVPAGPVPAEPEPAAPEPAAPEPVEPEPAAPEPAAPEPAAPEPVEPEPAAPEPVEPEPAEPVPAEGEPAEPEPTTPTVVAPPTSAPLPAVTGAPPSSVATRVDRVLMRQPRTGIVLGEVEVASFDDATSGVTLTWRRDRVGTLAGWIHPGTCTAPAPALILLRPLAPHEAASATRIPIAGSSLRLGGFVVVMRDDAGAVVSCVEFKP